MTPPSIRRRLLLSCVPGVALAATGCTSLVSRPAPVKEMFLLDPPLPPRSAAAPMPASLRVGTVNVAAAFRGKNLVIRRTELGYESDYYDEFFVSPAIMIADVTARALAAANVFARVIPPGAAGNEGDFQLDAFVAEFYADLRSGRGAAVARISFYVSALAAPGTAPVWTREYSERAALQGSGAPALADGLNRALGAVLAQLARDLAGADLRAG